MRREYRESTRPERLLCRKVVRVAPGIHRFEVGRSLAFDWSWEGSTAFRPRDLGLWSETHAEDELLWSGEVIEVDSVHGHLYLAIDDEEFEADQGLGALFVHPFPYLGPLRQIYGGETESDFHDQLARRLLITTHGRGEPIDVERYRGRPDLEALWRLSWSCLWGPPGTGKTWTIGDQVARVLAMPESRLLVVSTTNRATDQVALSIGKAMRRLGGGDRVDPWVVRVGKGADWDAFAHEDLTVLLHGSESEARQQLARLRPRLRAARDAAERAGIRRRIVHLMRAIENGTATASEDPRRRVLVTTAFNALYLLASTQSATDGERPRFDTVILDEAGLLSRAVTAALSLLAGRRVMLVGDPHQLAPIAQIARVLPPARAMWLQSSALAHLEPTEQPRRGVHMLRRQYRMHPEVRRVVSRYQYDDLLLDAAEVIARTADGHRSDDLAPATWYVLDEDAPAPDLRAERGPGQRSWVRPCSLEVLAKLFQACPTLAKGPGLFLSPFVAQAQRADTWLAHNGHADWAASTVHAQQGAEARFVVFDTVNAGSHVWPIDEWRRLINVGISRAQQAVVLLASRLEMREPYLRPLRDLLAPRALTWRGSRYFWTDIELRTRAAWRPQRAAEPSRLGAQLSSRKAMRPLLSREQERLCGLELDGRPRLVRGVAGSGKTVILANWLARTVSHLAGDPLARIWIVYANKSLRALIEDLTEEAWESATGRSGFPWQRVEQWHVQQLLQQLSRSAGLRADFGFDFELAARRIRDARGDDPAEPLCQALFIDEAQDLGHDTLGLLTGLVEHGDHADLNSRNLIVFYDNAQNLYGRGTPTWSAFGVDMRGRSTVLTESFRSTRPIAELALNVLYRLVPPGSDPDHKELVARGLIEAGERNGNRWWTVRFNQIGGPAPALHHCADPDHELAAVVDRVVELVAREEVCPRDIVLLYLGKPTAQRLQTALQRRLRTLGARAEVQTSQTFTADQDCVVITTPHSFKGYDAEVVLVVGAERFRSKQGILASSLYVAMTRARSILEVFFCTTPNPDVQRIAAVLQSCAADQASHDRSDPERLRRDDLEPLVQVLGEPHRRWVERLAGRYRLSSEPLRDAGGAVLAHPLLRFEHGGTHYAVLEPRRPRDRRLLEEAAYTVLEPGSLPG